jgi:predicted DNA-binding ribbon-helix-helix protein
MTGPLDAAPGQRPAAMAKRSVMLSGHSTSVSIETPFWDALHQIAARRQLSLNALIAEIDAARAGANLSSAIRLAVLADLQARAQGAAG